jgi:hypothetical protein
MYKLNRLAQLFAVPSQDITNQEPENPTPETGISNLVSINVNAVLMQVSPRYPEELQKLVHHFAHVEKFELRENNFDESKPGSLRIHLRKRLNTSSADLVITILPNPAPEMQPVESQDTVAAKDYIHPHPVIDQVIKALCDNNASGTQYHIIKPVHQQQSSGYLFNSTTLRSNSTDTMAEITIRYELEDYRR